MIAFEFGIVDILHSGFIDSMDCGDFALGVLDIVWGDGRGGRVGDL